MIKIKHPNIRSLIKIVPTVNNNIAVGYFDGNLFRFELSHF